MLSKLFYKDGYSSCLKTEIEVSQYKGFYFTLKSYITTLYINQNGWHQNNISTCMTWNLCKTISCFLYLIMLPATMYRKFAETRGTIFFPSLENQEVDAVVRILFPELKKNLFLTHLKVCFQSDAQEEGRGGHDVFLMLVGSSTCLYCQ